MWSMTRISTMPFVGSSLGPSCSCSAVKMEGRVASSAEGGCICPLITGRIASTGAHRSAKSYFAVRPDME
jgi:hypothetical protein